MKGYKSLQYKDTPLGVYDTSLSVRAFLHHPFDNHPRAFSRSPSSMISMSWAEQQFPSSCRSPRESLLIDLMQLLEISAILGVLGFVSIPLSIQMRSSARLSRQESLLAPLQVHNALADGPSPDAFLTRQPEGTFFLATFLRAHVGRQVVCFKLLLLKHTSREVSAALAIGDELGEADDAHYRFAPVLTARL